MVSSNKEGHKLNPPSKLRGVTDGVLPTDAVNKRQLDEAVGTTIEANNNDFTGTNTHSGTETFSHATGVTTDTITERTAAAGVTVDGALIKDGGISANSMFAGFFPTAAGQALSGPGAVNVTAFYTAWTTTGSNDAGTLANGTQIGQRKKIKMIVDGGDGILTPVALSGATTITFNDVGDYVELIWGGAAWFVIENFGCTVA